MSEASKPRPDGFTEDEGVVADHLCAAVNAFAKLPRQHPDEARDFCDAIRRLQDLMVVRIVRRDYPLGWPTYADGKIPTRETTGDDANA